MINKDFKRGVLAAAAVAADYNSSTTHPFRLDDCIACKLNVVGRKKARKNLWAIQAPKKAFAHGMGLALAELHRKTGNSAAVAEVARDAGLTLAELRDAGVDAYDLKELRKAGVK